MADGYAQRRIAMRIREWLESAAENTSGGIKLRVILKSGHELDIEYNSENDIYGSENELTDGGYMIDMRSIAAIQWVN